MALRGVLASTLVFAVGSSFVACGGSDDGTAPPVVVRPHKAGAAGQGGDDGGDDSSTGGSGGHKTGGAAGKGGATTGGAAGGGASGGSGGAAKGGGTSGGSAGKNGGSAGKPASGGNGSGGAPPISCGVGTGDCDHDNLSCETDTTSDDANCGSCGHVCDADKPCTGGQCACSGVHSTATRAPLDIHIMLDTSGSMLLRDAKDIRWFAVSNALTSFFFDPASNNIGVALSYFPVVPAGDPLFCTPGTNCPAGDACTPQDPICGSALSADTVQFCPSGSDSDCNGNGSCAPVGFCGNDINTLCNSNADCGGSGCVKNHGLCQGSSCDVGAYSTPAIPFDAVQNNAPMLQSSIAGTWPAGETPTAPALAGAIAVAQQQKAANADHVVAVILVTDGVPAGSCGSDIQPSVDAATAGAAAGIHTYVIGVGPSLDTLNAIAVAGGTGAALPVDTGGDVEVGLLAALSTIRGESLSCSFALPAVGGDQTFNKAQVNVSYTPGNGGTGGTLVNRDDAGCGSDNGWTYDNPAAPTSINLCPTTCQLVAADPSGTVDIEVGCTTIKPLANSFVG